MGKIGALICRYGRVQFGSLSQGGTLLPERFPVRCQAEQTSQG